MKCTRGGPTTFRAQGGGGWEYTDLSADLMDKFYWPENLR